MTTTPLPASARTRAAPVSERLPPALALSFILVSSTLLWALIGWGVRALLR